MPVSESVRIVEEQDAALDKINIRCRNRCPRVRACNFLLWEAAVKSIELKEDSPRQNQVSQEANAALGALRDMAIPVNEICQDGPYYSEPGFLPSPDGQILCKLKLVEDRYVF